MIINRERLQIRRLKPVSESGIIPPGDQDVLKENNNCVSYIFNLPRIYLPV